MNVHNLSGTFKHSLLETHTIFCFLGLKLQSAAHSSAFLSSLSLRPSLSLSCPANYPSVPIIHSRPSLCPALYLYQYSSHLSISHLQGNSNYLCTCVLHTIIAAPLINATLLIPCRLTDRTGTRAKTPLNCHMQTQQGLTTLDQTQADCGYITPTHTASHTDTILMQPLFEPGS